jgi:uncharacterized protein YjbI with pentapeptide repeats
MDKKTPKGATEFEPPKYLASLIAAINDGAKAAQGGALVFMLVGIYLLATAFSSSDEDLLLGKTVTISQIGASLPVSFSFAIAPLVFVFLHVYTLVRYDMLAANVRQFLRELRNSVRQEPDRERCRQLLANVEFVAALTIPRGSTLYSRIWPSLFFGIVALFPVAVLLLVQINALRYQSDMIVWVQRAWLALDLAVLTWFFVRDPFHVGETKDLLNRRRAVRGGLLFGAPALVLLLNFAWLGPASPEADPALVRYDPRSERWKVHGPPSFADVVRQPLDILACRGLNWGCRYLRVDRRTLVDHVWDAKAMADLHSTGAEPAKALAGIEGVVLRGRSLRFAVLDASRLYAADLVGADLRGASLEKSNLLGATLSYTILDGADLRLAQLQGADLSLAHLRGANLTGAQLQGARLPVALLQGADLTKAQLQGADLSGAQLMGADLSGAQLQRADLRSAVCKGADLRNAQLQGANLTGAWLLGADLTWAQLQGADLTEAQLQGADLSVVGLQGALLIGAHLEGADLHNAQLQGAGLSLAHLQGADLTEAQLQGANLHVARLWHLHSTKPADFSLADVRDADFHTALTESERDFLRKERDFLRKRRESLDPLLPSGRIKVEAEKRLEPLLAAGGEVVGGGFDFVASRERPVLVSASTEPALARHSDWLITEPTAAYTEALNDYLASELASTDPAIAEGIARILSRDIRYDIPGGARARAVPIACRLLSETKAGRIKLAQSVVDELSPDLKKAKQDCPAVAQAP